MAQTSDQKLVNYIQHASAVIEKAGAIEAADGDRRRKVAAAIPAAVDEVVASGLVDEADRRKLAGRLDDPAFALQMLKRAAAEIRALKAASTPRTLGEPASAGRRTLKAASAGTPFYGGQRVHADRESDRNWESALGYR